MAETDAQFLARVGLFGSPEPDPAAVLTAGNARFTVLTDRLLRLEWAPDGRFTDLGSYAFPTRRGPVPEFTAAEQDGGLLLDTGALRLRYRPDGTPFNPENLTIELATLPGVTWQPGQRDRLNLGGARRTVDTCRGDARLEAGLVSRSGWALHDDSTSLLLDERGWAVPRPADPRQLDWYFFGYGHDYPAAVADYTAFGGAVPLVPRWLLGAWWSRYWPYTDAELRQVVLDFASHRLPLDVVVIDMDWHLPDSWTGYTWNRELFPDPAGFLGWLHDRDLRATLNLHPALGVQPFEEAYPHFVEAMNHAGDEAATFGVDDPVPFGVDDPAFMHHYFHLLHHPLEEQGVDFWWMDWQQGREFGSAGIDPLPWLNHLHFTDLGRHPDRRPITFSRWGGLGSHRYPIGFSGDSFAQWSALRFQPRYTAAGANVAYGWWSHDIGGHVGPDEPGLYVRWVQFGAVSPVLRLHSNQDPESERRPWKFGDAALDAAREAFELRYRLLPYLYTAARTAADTGLAPVRPLSWAAPDDDSAYAARYQYQLGEAMVVAPVMHPVDPASGLAVVDAWLPPGEWVERTTLERFTGPRWVRQLADLHRVPQFVRLGSILPLAEPARSTSAQPADRVVLEVFCGASGGGRLYSDDGTTRAYADGECGWTEFSTDQPEESSCRLRIGSDGAARAYTVRLLGTSTPVEVLLDGAPHPDWEQDGEVTVVRVPAGAAELLVRADGPLSVLDAERNARRLAADLGRLLGQPGLSPDDLLTAVLSLPADDPARLVAIGRLGGPALRVDEHTAPDEAEQTLGRLVVGVGPAERVSVQCTWTLWRGDETLVYKADPVSVAAGGQVFDAPFRWDDTLIPARWELAVAARWQTPAGEVALNHRHRSAVLNPSLAAWTVSLNGSSESTVRADPFDPDFSQLTDRYPLPLRHHPGAVPDGPTHLRATARLRVTADCTAAFSYLSSDEVRISLDGEPVPADVTGRGPSRFYAPDPQPRQSEPVRLTAGEHDLLLVCDKAPELPWSQWTLSVSVVDPATGEVLLPVTAIARPQREAEPGPK